MLLFCIYIMRTVLSFALQHNCYILKKTNNDNNTSFNTLYLKLTVTHCSLSEVIIRIKYVDCTAENNQNVLHFYIILY